MVLNQNGEMVSLQRDWILSNQMLYPLVVSPSFILKMKDDEKYFKSFIEFYKKYRDVWTDIFVLIDDDKNTLI